MYWFQGLKPRFVLGGQLRALASGVKGTVHTVVVGPLILLLVPLADVGWTRRRDRSVGSRGGDDARVGPGWWRLTLRALADNAYLALAVAGILTYVPLLVVDRYIAVYVAIIVITAFLFACGRLAGHGAPRHDRRPSGCSPPHWWRLSRSCSRLSVRPTTSPAS